MEVANQQFVWAKMKKMSAWPAKVCEIAPDHILKPKKSEDRICVYFFGTHN